MFDPDQPLRIVVEVVSSAEVRRLEKRDDDVMAEIVRVEGRVEAQNRLYYELLDVLRDIRAKLR